MIFLRTIERLGDVVEGSGFPFDLPPVRGIRKLELTSPITFFAGENGSGKSTLLEAIALRARLTCPAGKPLELDPSLLPIHPLARSLRLNWAPPTKYGFFLRVEDFFSYSRERRVEAEVAGSVTVKMDGKERVYASAHSVPPKDQNDGEATGLSAGERFLDFLQEHCQPGGIHLIDEPEAALSPQRQVAFMKLLKSFVAENAQFIIATHSPILVAFPHAQILSFSDGTVSAVTYDQLEHVNFTRSFLANPEQHLRML